MTSYSTLFSTIAPAFESALSLPTNFFLVQHQTVPENLASSSTQQPFGRLWIDSLTVQDGQIAETYLDYDSATLLDLLQAPCEFNLIVHFYREGARDLARRLAIHLWDANMVAVFNSLNVAVIGTSDCQNTPEIRQQLWTDHSMIKITFAFIDAETARVPNMTELGEIVAHYQDTDNSVIEVEING